MNDYGTFKEALNTIGIKYTEIFDGKSLYKVIIDIHNEDNKTSVAFCFDFAGEFKGKEIL